MECNKDNKNASGFSPLLGGSGCCGCKIESLLSVDERGQMVLPKSIREKAGINPGDKLALLTWESEGKVCMISLVRADDIAQIAKNMLGPLMKELT